MRQWNLLLLSVSFVGSVVVLPTVSPSFARAEVVPGGGDVPPVTSAAPGLLSVRRGVQGPEGLTHARVLFHVNTSKGSVAEPFSLAPDLYHAVTDSLQLGLLHNGPMGWLTRPGPGLCFSGTSGGCPKVYNNVGFDMLYGLLFGDVHLSLHTSFFVLQIADPTPLMLTVGLAGKFHFSEDVALFFDPQIGIALSDRDKAITAPLGGLATGEGGVVNADRLFFPFELQFQIVPPVTFKLLSGITGPLDGLGEAYQIPLGLGIVGNVSESVDIGLRFSFDNLLGKIPPGGSRTQASSLALLMHVRF